MSPARSHDPNKPPRARTAYDDKRYKAAVKILRTYSHTCHICGHGIDVQLKWPHPMSWTADHIIAVSHLDTDDPRRWHISNLTGVHSFCNTSRNNRPLKPPKALDW
jgi:5-methylcytosine-specific restriction endonuclease McrA